MNTKSQYKTKQRAELVAFLMSTAGEHFTVSDICAHFEKKNKPISVTTVYRQLDKMVEEGLVSKYTMEGNSSACYEYVGQEHEHTGAVSCYHCKCEECGKLIHLHCEEIESLINHLSADHGFSLNPRRTVLFGLCEDCKKEA